MLIGEKKMMSEHAEVIKEKGIYMRLNIRES